METPRSTTTHEAGESLNDLSQFLIELAQRRAWGRVELTVEQGRITLTRFTELFKPGKLPIRDRARVDALHRSRG